jgi:HAD superfamily hydrolase (TIGR01509 family)
MQPSRGAPAAVVFDMDGLLLDSERLALEAFVGACRQFGFEPDIALYLPCIGTRSETTRELLQSGYGAGFPYDEIAPEWARRYRELTVVSAVPLKAGARGALTAVRDAGLPVGIATSTKRDLARHKLERAGLWRLVNALVAGDDVAAGKPHPAPYLEAARRLGAEVRDCWAVEDSAVGVRSARAAGCQVMEVPDMVAPDAEIRALGHAILPTLDAFVAHFRAHYGADC